MLEDTGSILLACWNTPDTEYRKAMLGKLLAPEFHYTDPHLGPLGLNKHAYIDYAEQVKDQFPELYFSLSSSSHHHDVGLIDWELRLFAGSAASLGSFYFILDKYGAILRRDGFARSLVAGLEP